MNLILKNLIQTAAGLRSPVRTRQFAVHPSSKTYSGFLIPKPYSIFSYSGFLIPKTLFQIIRSEALR